MATRSKTLTSKVLARKLELYAESVEDYLKQRGWKYTMFGWYWVWSSAVEFVDNEGIKQIWQFTCRNKEEALAADRIVEELTYGYKTINYIGAPHGSKVD